MAGEYTNLVLDYSGTLALDGVLLPGVADRLSSIAVTMHITVLTADTFGTAAEQLKGLPVELRIIGNGAEKAAVVEQMGSKSVIAIGNGRNDVPMMNVAGLGIAVIGPEGAAGELLCCPHVVVVRDVLDALDLITHPVRRKATLRD